MSKKKYTVYHLHDDTSNCNGYADSCTRYNEYIKLAKEQGMKAIAFSNHGGIYDWIKKKQACDKAGIKYVHGVEEYVCIELTEDDRGGHIGLYAKNWQGVLELNTLTSIANQKGELEDNNDRHMYYNPRISLEELMNTSDNIIVTSACLASPLNKWDCIEKRDAFQTLIKWMMKNKHRCFLEVQYHNCESQKLYNQKMYLYSKKTGIPLIAGTDTHSSSSYKAECRKILQKYKKSFYGEEDEFDLTWKTYDELVAAFKEQGALSEKVYLEAIENTNKFADMIEDFTLDKAFKYPTLYGDNVREQWKQLIYTNFNNKRKNGELKLPSKVKKQCEKYFAEHPTIPTDETGRKIYETHQKYLEWANTYTDNEVVKQYQEKIIEEFKVMCKLEMESFMMFMSELISWAKDNNIPCGTGRGSVCGSEIAFITNITDVDPMVWNTVFSRFCNEDRISLGDIDVDFAGDDRERVYQYIIERFTPEKTAYIAAFSTLQDRGCIDVLAGGLGYQDLDKVMEIKNKFDEFFSGYSKIVQEEVDTEGLVENGETESSSITFDNHEIYMLHIAKEKKKKQLDNIKNQYDKLIKDNQDLFYYLKGLKGTIVAKGTHPSGIIGSPITLADNIGLFYKDGDKNMPVSTCAMKAVDSLNYVKFDILGLKTVGIIKDACEYAGIPYPKSYALNWDDAKVWDNMIQAQQGVFQFEGDYAFALLKDFKPCTINHMSMVNAALRPSGKSYRDRMIAGEHNENPSEEIDTLLASNNGYLCIEENQMIATVDGLKKIKNIQTDDIVYTSDGISKVNQVYYNGIQDVYKLETAFGTIECTENHKILTENGWKRYRDIQIGESICHRVGTSSGKNYDLNKLKLIGWTIGDGITSGNNIQFINRDYNVVLDYKKTVESIWDGLEVVFRNVKSRVNKVSLYRCNVKWIDRRKKCDKPIHEYFSEIGLRKKQAKEKFIPNFVFSLSRECLLTLLGTYTDTDSCINKNCVNYKTSSKQLSYDLVELIRLVGYSASVCVNNEAYNICVKGANELLAELRDYSIKVKKTTKDSVIKRQNKLGKVSTHIITDWLTSNGITKKQVQKEVGITLYRKYVNVESIKKICDTFDLIQPIIINDNIHYSPVINKEYVGLCNVYDLEIDNVHNFIANGIVVHNCFQEDTIKFLTDICGFTGSEADSCRRAIGKKDKELLEQQLPKILDGYCNHSPKERAIAEEEAKQFVQIVKDSSEYQFGYNHSTAYSMNGYECVWLRTYYTVEFIAAYLNRAENKDDTNYGIELAKMNNIEILPIKFGKSSAKYTIDRKNNAIYKGIASIKYCNESIAAELLELSKNHYDSFFDLLDDISKKTSVNNRQLCILTGLNFFSDFGKNKYLLNLITLYNGVKKKEGKSKSPKVILPPLRTCSQLKKEKFEVYEEYGLTEYLVKKYSGKETAKQYSNIDNLGLLNELASRLDNKSMSVIEQCKFEKEYLEYIIYINPDIADFYYIVTEFVVHKNATKPYLTLRNLKTGEEIKTKIKQSKIYRSSPFGEFSILKIEGFTLDYKSKLINGEWTKSEELEPILENYEVIKG